MDVVVVHVPAAETWPCERCGVADVVAYTGEDSEVTFGYCAACLGPAIQASFALMVTEDN